MHPAGANVYPVSERLTARFHQLRLELEFETEEAHDRFEDIVHDALEYLGEYEHGSVDVKDLVEAKWPAQLLSTTLTIEMMADILFDFIAYMTTVNDDMVYKG